MSAIYPDLEPTHWTLETIYSATPQTAYLDEDCVEVSVSAEVPMAGDVRVCDRGHRSYPTDVLVEGWDVSLRLAPEHARALASALLRAAEVAAAHDAKDADVCGHWYPCHCQQEARC